MTYVPPDAEPLPFERFREDLGPRLVLAVVGEEDVGGHVCEDKDYRTGPGRSNLASDGGYEAISCHDI
jgi:hypothetical protein